MIEMLLMRPETDWRLYPTVFGCATLIFGIINMNRWALVKAALVTALLYFVPMVICGSVVICLVVAFSVAEFRDNSQALASTSSESAYTYDNPRAPIQGAVVTEINGHTIQVDANGLSFLIWKEPDGTTFAQKLNKEGYTVGSKVGGAPNAWQFGMSVDQSLAEYIKRVINQRGTL